MKPAILRRMSFSILLSAGPVLGWEFSSAPVRTTTVELYTSEGCSSCPPAEAWLSTFLDDPGLFENVLPLAFHVDYWDMLGWRDRFASAENSMRQRRLAADGFISQVYTPGLVVNSREWRGWFKGQREAPKASETVGVLSAQLPEGGETLSVSFTPAKAMSVPLMLHVAVLGMGLETEVKAGENRGETLPHQFVVLSHQTKEFNALGKLAAGKAIHVSLPTPAIPARRQQRSALAIWVSELGSQSIIQATAAYFPES